MTANQRIKIVRNHRKLTSKELATKARVSPSAVSLIERKMRRPTTETLQRLAAALEVSTSYLLSETHADLPLEEALAREAFQIFARDAGLAVDELRRLRELSESGSAPQSVQGWRDFYLSLTLYQKLSNR